MTTQPDLLKIRKHTKVSQDDVDIMIEILRGNGWINADNIGLLAAKYPYCQEWNDREVRAIANASNGRIISGQRGYCLTREASEREVQH